MSLFGSGDGLDGGASRPERLLVRVLLALRCEAKRSPDQASDRLRAEALADRIMCELPRSVIPLGIAALVIAGVVCAEPLLRDALTERRALVGPVPVATAVEAGIRENGAALQDGFAALRAIVEPFGDSAGVAEPCGAAIDGRRPCGVPPCEAAAPYPKS